MWLVFLLVIVGRWIDGLDCWSAGYVGMRVSQVILSTVLSQCSLQIRIVEYATREQAQQAVNTLSNQNLMGRLVYVREVRLPPCSKLDLVCARVHNYLHKRG